MTDFVFIDDRDTPLRVRERGGKLWLFRLTEGKQWVSVRELKGQEIGAVMMTEPLAPELRAHYEFGVPFHAPDGHPGC